jgi:hypothetical protein
MFMQSVIFYLLPFIIFFKAIRVCRKSEKLCFFQLYAFNKVVSDQISVKREMPDTRHADCRKIDYDRPETLPNTSVILIFCNEALSVLLR